MSFVLLFIVVLAALVLFTYYRRDLRAAQARLDSFPSRLVETKCGAIEYGEAGEGYPVVLMAHPLIGGHDHGLDIARTYFGEGRRIIAPSRFGYLQTPLPEQASPADQADAYACLLDALGVDQVVVMGYSAGTGSAIQFTLRHPERAAGLILLGPNSPGEAGTAGPPRAVAEKLFHSDFGFWLAITAFRPALDQMLGVPAGYALTPEQETYVKQALAGLLPVSKRGSGTLHDLFVSNPDINNDYPFEAITRPTLVIAAADDPLCLYQNVSAMAARIPGARLATVESGGHMFLGQQARVQQEIAAFLQEPRLAEVQTAGAR